jgi:hypothetical protein
VTSLRPCSDDPHPRPLYSQIKSNPLFGLLLAGDQNLSALFHLLMLWVLKLLSECTARSVLLQRRELQQATPSVTCLRTTPTAPKVMPVQSLASTTITALNRCQSITPLVLAAPTLETPRTRTFPTEVDRSRVVWQEMPSTPAKLFRVSFSRGSMHLVPSLGTIWSLPVELDCTPMLAPAPSR